MDKFVNRVSLWRGMPDRREELSRSQYSLVSSGELTAGALQLWLGLPDEVKYDPALQQFKQHYEKEHGAHDQIPLTPRINGAVPTKRLPSVASAPHLNNNVQEVTVFNGNCHKDEKKQTKILEEEEPVPEKKSTLATTKHLVKMFLLVACWLFFTVIFMMYNEKEEVVRHSSVSSTEVKNYVLNRTQGTLSVYMKLKGPFMTEQNERKLNTTEKDRLPSMKVWLEQWRVTNVKDKPYDMVSFEKSSPWILYLDPQEKIDFTTGELRTSTIRLHSNKSVYQENLSTSLYAIVMTTTSALTIPFTLEYTLDPLDLSTGVIYSCLLLCALYALIIFEASPKVSLYDIVSAYYSTGMDASTLDSKQKK